MYKNNDDSWMPVKGRSKNRQSNQPQQSKGNRVNSGSVTSSQNSPKSTSSFTATSSVTPIVNGNGYVPSSNIANNRPTSATAAKMNGPSSGLDTNVLVNGSTNNDRSNSYMNGNSTNYRVPSALRNDQYKQQLPQKNGLTSYGDPRKAIDREIKSLNRYEANIKNTSWLFEEEIKKSQDRLKRAFVEMRDRLNQRERDLQDELDKCKSEGLTLLADRQDMEHQLKAQTARIGSSTSAKELEDLRQKIKKFMHEKRLEEELGKTLRFQYEPDKLIECIGLFGDVQPIYGRPGNNGRKSPSVTSLVSADGADQSSIDSSLVTTTTKQQPVINQVNIGGLVIKSDSMDPAQLADLTRQLQESLKLQGISEEILPEVAGTLSCPMPQRRPPGPQMRKRGGGNNTYNNNRQSGSSKKPTAKII